MSVLGKVGADLLYIRARVCILGSRSAAPAATALRLAGLIVTGGQAATEEPKIHWETAIISIIGSWLFYILRRRGVSFGELKLSLTPREP